MKSLPPNRILLLSFCIILICSSFFSKAQDSPLKVEQFTTENGLSSNVVYCILQDKNGWLWIGTNDGLNRFDGYIFKTYRFDPADSNSMPSNSILSICEDQDGNLWVLSNGGLCRYNKEKNNFTRVVLKNHSGISQILSLNKDELFISVDNSLLLLNIHSLKTKSIKIPVNGYSNYYFGTITRDHKNNFYLFSNTADTIFAIDTANIFRYIPEENQVTRLLSFFNVPKLLGYGRIFFTDTHNGNWIGTMNNGSLFHYLPSKESKPDLNHCLLKESIGTVNEIFEDKDGKIWIATAKGLFRFDYTTNTFNEINYNNLPVSSNTTLTTTVFQDRSGLIWIGSYSGLFKLNPARGKFSHFTAGQQSLALKDNFILGLYTLPGNKVWINYQWGIRHHSVLDIADHSIRHFALNDQSFKTYVREAWLQNPQYADEKVFQQWTRHHLPYSGALPFFLAFDRQKNLWLSNTIQLQIMLKEHGLKFPILMDEKISGDDIWLATDGAGLQSFNTVKESVTKYIFNDRSNSISSNHLTCLLTEKNGDLWIGTRGYGLNYFDRQKNTFIHYTIDDGLCNNSVFNLVKDDKERLWIGTAKGISCLDLSTHIFKNYFRSDGLVNSEFNRYSACKLENGYILMGGMDGIDYFHPDSVFLPPVKPQVQITDLKVFNKSVFPFSGVSLAHDQNYVSIEFAVMDYHNPGANKFEYKLEGIDKDWVTAGYEHSISYATLSPGHYHFLVKAANSEGIWSDVPAEIYFNISTPWWKSWWFLCIVGLFVISVLYSIYQFRIHQLKRIFAVRSKISRDLHDEVGATLTSISFLSEVVKKQTGNGGLRANENIEKIGEFSRDMIGEMNDIVWAINPANDKFEKIEDRMQNFASILLATKNIQFNFESDNQIKNIFLGMQQRKNLYLIFKEAVNNAAKYANCNIVNVKIFKEDHHICLYVSDNGKGFEIEHCDNGNGIKNMQTRAAEIKGKISIESRLGKGTNISLSMPITQNAY